MGKVSSFLGIRKKNLVSGGLSRNQMTGWSQKYERLMGGNTWERSRGEQAAWGRESLTDLPMLLLPLLLVSKRFIKTKKCYRTYLLCCLPGVLWLQVLDSSFYPHCEFTFMDGIRWSNFLFCMQLSSFPTTPHWRTSCLFPIIYSGSFALIGHVYMSISGLCSVQLIYMSVFIPIHTVSVTIPL